MIAEFGLFEASKAEQMAAAAKREEAKKKQQKRMKTAKTSVRGAQELEKVKAQNRQTKRRLNNSCSW